MSGRSSISDAHVVVVGGGAVGGTIAAYLARSGQRVTIVEPWAPHAEAIRRAGLRIEAPDETFAIGIPVVQVDELAELGAPADLAIIAVKAYDTEWAARLIAPYVKPDGTVLVAQNGLTEPWVKRCVGDLAVLGCAVDNLRAESAEPGTVKRTIGRTGSALSIGEPGHDVDDRVRWAAEILQPVADIHVTDDIFGSKWGKLGLNNMTNALAGATGLTTTRLWSDPALAAVGLLCAAETARAAQLTSNEMTPVFGRIPASDLLALRDGDPAAWERSNAVVREMAASRQGKAENKPSLLQDMLKGRRTEIEYLNGFIVRVVTEHGEEAPANANTAEVLRAVARGDRSRGIERADDLVLALHSYPAAAGLLALA